MPTVEELEAELAELKAEEPSADYHPAEVNPETGTIAPTEVEAGELFVGER